MMVDIHLFKCLADNYGFLFRDGVTGKVGCVDTPDADVILAEANRLGWPISYILNTHWHPDHAGGNAAVKAATGASVVGPSEVGAHYPVDRIVAPGDIFHVGEIEVGVIDSGGHTLGHVSYFLPDASMVFVGDTLFPMGCGKLFEGTAEQMWASLKRLANLAPETKVYAAHEYSLDNARFALSVDTRSEVLVRIAEIQAARSRNEATIPTTIGQERATNPFLRAPLLPLGLGAVDDAEAFARVRAAKDAFQT